MIAGATSSSVGRTLKLWGLGAFVAILIGLAFVTLLRSGRAEQVLAERAMESVGNLEASFVDGMLLNPWFYSVLAAVLVLEKLIPAQPGTSSFSRGFENDILWVPITLLTMGVFRPAYYAILYIPYERFLSFLTVESVESWPWLARLMLALLASDATMYLSHVLRHKWPDAWLFHAVHHSQKELNYFTEYRNHPVDSAIAITVSAIPAFIFIPDVEALAVLVWFRHFHTRFYHCNIRTNLGWLRYILVTPQSHRVHHSTEERHQDKNFGLTFSIWDYLFGTQYRSYDEYPETGISDDRFPLPQTQGRTGRLKMVADQFVYPFRMLAARL